MNDKFMKEPIVKVEHLSHRYIQWDYNFVFSYN